MASRISGITIEIGGDTTKLQTALKGVDSTLRTTQNNLRDINKLLKLDPKNTELLSQKQKNLETAIKATKDRLQELKDAQSGVEKGTAEWDALQREIVATEQDLKGLQDEYRNFGSVAKQQVQQAGKDISELGSKISDLGNKFQPISTAATGLLTGMGALGLKAVTASDDLNTLAKQTGLSTAEIQKMQYAADRIDVSFETVEGALRKMKPKMDESNETFKKLGVSVTDADGNLRSATDVFYDSVAALSQIENETERDQLAMELFGKSADDLAGIIDDGGAALKEYGDEAERLGLVLDQDTLDSLNETNDAIDKMKAQLAAGGLKVGAKIAEAAAPLVEKVAAALEKLAGWLDKLTPQQMELAMKVAAVVAAIGPALMIIGKIVSGVGSLISLFGALLSPVGLIIAAIVALIAIGVLLYKNWDKVKEKVTKAFQTLGKNIKKVCEDLKKNVKKAWDNIKKSVSDAVTNLKKTAINSWNGLKTSVTTIVASIKTSVVTAWENMKTSVSTTCTNLKTTVINSWDGLKKSLATIVSNIQTSVTTAWNNLKTNVTTAVTNLKTSVSTTWTNLKTTVTTTVTNMKTSIETTFTNLKSNVISKLSSLKSEAEQKWNGLKQKAEEIVKSIKNAFNFEWKLPKLKLPHVSVYGGEPPYGIGGKGSLPSFSVEWYKKAYDNAMLFRSPTVLATPAGYKGFGDGNGAEIVMGLNKLRELVGSYQGGGVIINVYAQQGMDVNQLADAIQSRFVALQKQRSLAYA